jgi:hypothetical protein
MKLLTRPLVTPPTSEQRFGRKLAKLIATMRRLEQPRPCPPVIESHRNGMSAFAEWQAKAE